MLRTSNSASLESETWVQQPLHIPILKKTAHQVQEFKAAATECRWAKELAALPVKREKKNKHKKNKEKNKQESPHHGLGRLDFGLWRLDHGADLVLFILFFCL